MVAISHQKVNGPGETTVVPRTEGFKISKNSAQFIVPPDAWCKCARLNGSSDPAAVNSSRYPGVDFVEDNF
jgi:hypothetical protein